MKIFLFLSLFSFCFGTHILPSLKQKISYLPELVRIQNIPPTVIFSSLGPVLQTHSLNSFLSIDVQKSILISCFFAMGSCVINDCFDYNIDKINKPQRLIASNKISVKEGFFISFILFAIPLLLSHYWRYNSVTDFITWFSFQNLIIYTPIFKKIPVVKNIVCSHIISSSILYSGISASQFVLSSNQLFDDSKNKLFALWNVCDPALQHLYIGLFFVTMIREINFDINDVVGDKINNINTIPVLIGEKKSKWLCSFLYWIAYSELLLSAITYLNRVIPII